jgi:23S rRNA (cytidine2498-2'-O)-methyltransferase
MPSAYLAASGYEAQLREELGDAVSAVHGRLFLSEAPPRPAAWAANIWRDPQRIAISSIGDAAQKLRAIQRNWSLYIEGTIGGKGSGRAKLIAEKLPHVSAKPVVFPEPAPTASLGSWTLLAPDRLLAASDCSSPFPNGEVQFVEDKTNPPNRAYLKLWEAFTVLRKYPQAGETCLDLGASPGGWSWVLAGLGAKVIAIDKAPLDPKVAALANVEWRGQSAFALDPASSEPVDWLFIDIACYPERLLGLVQRWLTSGKARNFICTIKFQGDTDHAIAAQFAAIPGAHLIHLHHNKHELTFALLR